MMTIEFWVRPDQGCGSHPLVGWVRTVDNNFGLYLYLESTGLQDSFGVTAKIPDLLRGDR